jgi:hypothetical protein
MRLLLTTPKMYREFTTGLTFHDMRINEYGALNIRHTRSTSFARIFEKFHKQYCSDMISEARLSACGVWETGLLASKEFQ